MRLPPEQRLAQAACGPTVQRFTPVTGGEERNVDIAAFWREPSTFHSAGLAGRLAVVGLAAALT